MPQKLEVGNLYFLRSLISVSDQEMCSLCFETEIHEYIYLAIPPLRCLAVLSQAWSWLSPPWATLSESWTSEVGPALTVVKLLLASGETWLKLLNDSLSSSHSISDMSNLLLIIAMTSFSKIDLAIEVFVQSSFLLVSVCDYLNLFKSFTYVWIDSHLKDII